jgi:hypothetical protein
VKKIFIFLFTLLLSFSIMGTANATLTDNGNNLIYDSDLNITWYDPITTSMSWSAAMSWAASLTVGGTTAGSWRLPTTVDGPYVWGYDGTGTTGYNITTSEMGYLYYVDLGNKGYYATDGTNPQPGWTLLSNKGPFTNLRPDTYYWSGTETEFTPYPTQAWVFTFGTGGQTVSYTYSDWYALAVHPGNVNPVPIPAAVWLLGSGLIGLIGLRRKFQK